MNADEDSMRNREDQPEEEDEEDTKKEADANNNEWWDRRLGQAEVKDKRRTLMW